MEDFVPITPVNFFQFRLDCHHVDTPLALLPPKKVSSYLLPDLSELCNEYRFAELAMGWSKEGIELLTAISKPFKKAAYPEISRGDSLELFFDTRDVKTSGFATRFCHHFFFLPESVDGITAGEISRFRTEDSHELCDGKLLKVKSVLKKNGYTLEIFIPSSCLFGYDPEQFDRMGFTYRINRSEGSPQHFCIPSSDFPLDQQPSLWSSVKLVK